jgi:PAS domain S-box-containing protein
MDRVSRSSWFQSARSTSVALLGLILLLGVGGYVLTSTIIRRDRDAAAERRARVEAVNAQEVLGRARAYVAGLAEVLAREPQPGQARFARWAAATSASVGLNDVLWVERVGASGRARYERRRGVPITRLTASGRIVRAPAAPSYLPATLTSHTRPELRPGVDVTGFPALGAAIHDRARIFAVGASRPGALGDESGFYLLQAAGFARRPDSGFLAAFVPRGWFATTLGGDPRRVAVSEDGQPIEGQLDSSHGSAGFEMLGRRWRIDVGRDPRSGLQSTLPWLALAWPFAVAGIVLSIAHATTLRRRAQREVERIFDLSADMISVIGFDGRFKAVNPAFERTLGYTPGDMLGHPFADFTHPDDLDASDEAFATVVGGDEVTEFENRYRCADGSTRWLQWSARALPDQGVVYTIARDVTERRRMDASLRAARRTAEARGAELQVRAQEQAALRRVATLVAREAPQLEVFTAVAEEIGRLLGTEEIRMLRYEDERSAIVVGSSGSRDTFPLGTRQSLEGDNATARVRRTGTTARVDDYGTTHGTLAETVRSAGIRSAVGAPIVVEGRLWGTIVAGSTGDEPLPRDTESRLGEFTELMATAIANTEARARADRLGEEQAALRRVATLIAKDVTPPEVFAKVAVEVAAVLGNVGAASLFRDEGDGTATVVAVSGLGAPVGTRMATDGDGVIATVLREGRSFWMDDNATRTGTIVERGRTLGIRSAIGCPIVVGGRVWGALGAARPESAPLPQGTETRLAQFAELVATAIANAEARAEVERLAEEQAALRRVATLVAEGVQPAELFEAVTQEVARLFLEVEPSLVPSIIRFDPGSEFVLVGTSKPQYMLPLGSRWGLKELYVSTRILRTASSARVDGADLAALGGPDAELLRSQGFLYQVGSPIVVEGRLWGAITMNSANALPADTGERLESFTELVATAIANAESREGLRQLADEQAGLRRVATLVAEGGSPSEVLDAVAAEMLRVLGAQVVTLGRYGPEDEVTVVAHRGPDAEDASPIMLNSDRGAHMSSLVRRTERTARVEQHGDMPGALGAVRGDFCASVGSPIVVEGRLWGVAIADWTTEVPPPADTEERMTQFVELLETAIANADSRDQLTASRVRLLSAADDARRRVVRDLHDGAQQRLVHTIVSLTLAERALGQDDKQAESLLGEALEHAQRGNAELRELAHGILPAALNHGGLRAGVDAVVARVDVPVEVDVTAERFAREIEASAYFIVAETLTNVVKHARAKRAVVNVSRVDGMLRVAVRDDGIGGADPGGHGLVGLADRATALGGRLTVESPLDGGTVVTAWLRLSDD